MNKIKIILLYLITLTTLILIGCNNQSYNDETTMDSTGTAIEIPTMDNSMEQITGVGLKNTGQISLHFYLLDGVQDKDEKILEPEDFGTDFKVAKSPCILKIKDQEGQWFVQIEKRYIFRFENGKWDLFEV